MPHFDYTPFPFNVTPASPVFKLSPVSSNISQGWVPSCFTPECVPTASWSTGSAGAILSFQFWGWDVAFNGNIKGNMSIEVFRDGEQQTWNPSEEVLFRSPGEPTDYLYSHNITLKVLDASPGAELTVNQARVNGSSRSFMDAVKYVDRWIIPSDDPSLKYNGFVPQASAAGAGSQTTYMSSKAGDTASMQFNGSAFLLYGPCGPTSGLMRVKVDDNESMYTAFKPIASNDCLLFQSAAIVDRYFGMKHQLSVQNVDGSTLSINRIEFLRVIPQGDNQRTDLKVGGIVAGVVLAVLAVLACLAIIRGRRSKETDWVI